MSPKKLGLPSVAGVPEIIQWARQTGSLALFAVMLKKVLYIACGCLTHGVVFVPVARVRVGLRNFSIALG